MKKWAVLAGLFLMGCTRPTGKPVTVFAAAGTASAMREIAGLFEAQTGTHVVFNFANAGVLAKQLASGASADVFFSANEKWMNFAADKEVIAAETRENLLSNHLVVVVPKGRAVRVDFTKPCAGRFDGRLAVGDSVTPVGLYAEQALSQLGWWKPLESHLCVGDTVQKVLNYVALNEADAGVVFQSVAICSADKVDIVGVIPSELHTSVRFPVAACAGASADGLAFLSFLKSEPAKHTFEKFGWRVINQKERDHV